MNTALPGPPPSHIDSDPVLTQLVSPSRKQRRVFRRARRKLDDDAASEMQPLLDAIKLHCPEVDLQLLAAAFELARDSHAGQMRKSGDPYITHPVAVAAECARLGLDEDTIAAALLHDVVEDTPVELPEIRQRFGDDIAHLVDGVTKLDQLQFPTKMHQQAETLRKMVVATAADVRVLLLKIADRLHNMRTMDAMPPEKAVQKATETAEIFVPLAHRLGMQQVKRELEDLSFRYRYPDRYEEICRLVEQRRPHREKMLAALVDTLNTKLEQEGVEAYVTGRRKSMWSTYRKMTVRGVAFEDIADLVGVRIIVEDTPTCYRTLGVVHEAFQPLPGSFKDYVATPKWGVYRSLHTAVLDPSNRKAEVQIRTARMHAEAEWGIAAHWRYKADSNPGVSTSGDVSVNTESDTVELPWIGTLADWQQHLEDPTEFLDTLRQQLSSDEVYVFTPERDVITLPAGATPVDFAYHIHTEVGHHTVACHVNGHPQPLDHMLKSGDTVEVVTDSSGHPSQEWLDFTVSPRARTNIRQVFNAERRAGAMERGRNRLEQALADDDVSVEACLDDGALQWVAQRLDRPDVDRLLEAVGDSKLPAGTVRELLLDHLQVSDQPEDALTTRSTDDLGVTIEGAQNTKLVRLARCCSPVPGDQIAAFRTRGRGVTVHQVDCGDLVQASARHPDQLLDASWTERSPQAGFRCEVYVEALDRPGLLADLASSLAELRAEVSAVESVTDRTGHVRAKFVFHATSRQHVTAAMQALQHTNGVFSVARGSSTPE